MDNFQIETAQNISIEQNVAGVGDRIVAFIIDGFIMLVYAVVMGLTMAGVELDEGGLWVYYLIIGLPLLLYYLLWETFYNGQTPGKAAMQIRVVRKDGTTPAFVNYLVRWLLRFIDVTLSSGGVAVVTILLNGEGQRLGDIAAGTSVISEKSRTGLINSLAVDLPPNYAPKYPQVTILTDQDVQVVKNLFQNARHHGQHHIILSLSQKLSELLEITPEERPVEFVKQVITDYNFYTQR